MDDKIQQLAKLQAIDLEIDSIDGEIKQEQEALDQRISTLADKENHIEELQAKLGNLEQEHRMLDAEMTDKMAHVKERQAKMMQVQTGREQTALLKEIEDAKKNAKENEEKIIAIIEQTEGLTSQLEEEKNVLTAEKQLVAEETDKVRKAIETITKSKTSKTRARNAQAKEIEAGLLSKYDILRQHRNGLAVVNVLQGVCQGCFMSIPPQQYNLLLRGDQLFDCPTCQRIMYHQAPAEDK